MVVRPEVCGSPYNRIDLGHCGLFSSYYVIRQDASVQGCCCYGCQDIQCQHPAPALEFVDSSQSRISVNEAQSQL